MSVLDEREIRAEDYGQHVRVEAFYPEWGGPADEHAHRILLDAIDRVIASLPRVDRPLTAGEAEGAIVHPATRDAAA